MGLVIAAENLAGSPLGTCSERKMKICSSVSGGHRIRNRERKRSPIFKTHKKRPRTYHSEPLLLIRQLPTFPGPHDPSIIGHGGLNFRVRNGNGCDPSGKTTGNLISRAIIITSKNSCLSTCFLTTGGKRNKGQATRPISTGQLNALLHLHLQPIDVVVYHRPLGGIRPGRSNLVEGFPLRCLQRLSRPDIATRHCHWHDNRNTRDPSIPVLSY